MTEKQGYCCLKEMDVYKIDLVCSSHYLDFEIVKQLQEFTCVTCLHFQPGIIGGE